jgi:hypothetical protein
VHSLVELKIKK